jgi:DNA polymerase-1
MSVLELARNAYAKFRMRHNAHDEAPEHPLQDGAVSAISAVSPCLPSIAYCPGPAYCLVADPADLQTVLQALDESVLVGLDTETTGLSPRTDRVRLLQLATDRGTYLVDCFAVDPRPLWDVLAQKTLVAHNAQFDLGMLAALGFEPGPVQDTMLLAQLLTAGTPERVSLAACSQRWLWRSLNKVEQKADWSQSLSPEQLRYAAADAEVLRPLHDVLAAEIHKARLGRAAEIETRCLPAVVWLAQAGIPFDAPAWEALAAAAAAEAERLGPEVDAAAPSPPPGRKAFFGDGWNWDSPAQVKEAFALLGVRLESTDDEVLAAVEHPLAGLVLRRRDARRRASTYGRDWLQFRGPDGRVYAGWKQIGCKTGRMSSSRPNMQNVPGRAEYRGCFRAPDGRVLIKADFSQIELRVAAKVASETRMIEAYRRGDDLHVLTARQLTGRAEVTKAERKLAKPVNFGLIYGLGAASLRRKAKAEYGVELTAAQAEAYRQAFFRAWPGIPAWHRRLARAGGTETRTLTGRRCVVARDFWHGGRANYVVQGSAGDGFKLALALLWERRHQCPRAFPVLAVHDEIVVEADAGQADTAVAWLRQAMLDGMAPLLDPVPVEVEVQVAHTWGGD